MNNNQNQQIVCQEDEIDLRELFLTLKRNKKIIVIVTALITLAAIAYVLLKTPVYEAKGLLELGNYKLDNNNNKVLLDNASQLSKKLNVIFINEKKSDEMRKSQIISINVPKKSNVFIEIKAEAISNDLAKNEVLKVVQYVQKSHQKILDDVKKRREFEIENIDRKINNIKTKEIKLLNEKIAIKEETLQKYKKELSLIDDNLKKIKKQNPVFAGLTLMERRNISDSILKLSIQLIELKDKKDNLKTNAIWELQEKKNILESMLLPYNYQNTHIVGDILTNDYPVKPKKKLIVVVAFVTGLILSIFLVFFIEFIKGLKEEENNE